MSDDTAEPYALELLGVSKTFPGVKALQSVDLRARAGEVHAIMGENGAGKSTLMKILSGAYRADPGARILIGGREVAINSPMHARELGVAVIYQELSLAPDMTVAENIYLGRPLVTRGVLDRHKMEQACRPVLDRLGADFGPQTLVVGLSIAQRQLVEIARAVHFQTRILVMDEPTTPLSSRETDRLFALIRRLREDGLAILYISHRMNEIDELADVVSVLRDGRYVGTLTRAELDRNTLVKMMVGRDLSGFYRKEHKAQAGGEVLRVEDFADGDKVRKCSFKLRAGEVVGLAGLVGSGRTELAKLIYGAAPRSAGRLWVEGQQRSFQSPAQAISAGVLYLTEDRKGQGLFLDLSVHENINTLTYATDSRFSGFLDLSRARLRSSSAIERLSIRVASPHVAVGSLSGGNQQKALLARLLERSPKVLILDEPTRGVDVGAKSEIYRLIDELANKGVAVLVISSELPEVVGICDRVLVMREGQIAGELGADSPMEISQENIIAIATRAGALSESTADAQLERA